MQSSSPSRFAAALACTLALWASAAGPAPAQERPPVAPAAQQQDSTALQPGDLVRLLIWREPDMSGDFLVDESGAVTLPMLGSRRAAGVPIATLRAGLIRDFQVQLRNPSITITPLRRINVLGEVNKPGVYPVDMTATVSEVVAMAGGVNPTGDPRRVSIVRRDGRVLQDRVSVEASLTQTGIRSGDQVVVGRRSWVDRNSATLLATGISILASVVTTLIIYGKNNP